MDFDRRRTIALFVLCSAIVLDSMDVSLMTVALPSIQSDLETSSTSAQLLISGYTVAYGGFLVLGGRVADVLGRRRVFLVSLALFAAASVVGGLLSSEPLLISSRVVKGVAAAFTAPAALSLITTTFAEGPARNRALGVFALAGAAGFSSGLVLSGLLTSLDWRLVFFVPAPIAIGVLVTATRVLDAGTAPSKRASFDAFGALTVTTGLLLLVYSIAETNPLTAVVAAALLAVFVVIERRHADPLIAPALVRTGTVAAANGLALVWAAATIGWQFTVVQYLRDELGYSAMITGLAIVPLGVMVIVAGRSAGPLVQRIGLARLAAIGMACQAVGVFSFAFVGSQTSYLAMLPAFLIHGIGNGFAFTCFNVAATAGVEDARQGVASGLVTASVQVGSGCGVAVLAALAASGEGLDGYHAAFIAGGVFAIAGLAVALTVLRRPFHPSGGPVQPVLSRAGSRGDRVWWFPPFKGGRGRTVPRSVPSFELCGRDVAESSVQAGGLEPGGWS